MVYLIRLHLGIWLIGKAIGILPYSSLRVHLCRVVIPEMQKLTAKMKENRRRARGGA